MVGLNNGQYHNLWGFNSLSSTIWDLLSRTSKLLQIINPQIYLGGSDWSTGCRLWTSHPPCPVLCLLNACSTLTLFAEISSTRLLGVVQPSLHCAWIIHNHGTAVLINIPPGVEGIEGGGGFGKQCAFLGALYNTFIQSALSEVQPQDAIVFDFKTSLWLWTRERPPVTLKTTNLITTLLGSSGN